MEEFLLDAFQGELKTQCELILVGATFVNEQLGRRGDTSAIWFGLQGILISASNASKLLWGSRREPVMEARRPLRESVDVDDTSALSSRRLRNDFEHFDERLEEWFAGSTIYLGRNIGPTQMLQISGMRPTDVFGHFDPTTATVSFWEHSADLNAITREANRILMLLRQIQEHRP